MSITSNSFYNNYLSTYAPKSVTKYDTHKKSELKSVYDSIVKMNKDSPWYLPTTSKETQHYAIDVKENARSLHNTLAGLGGLEEEGIFSKRSAYSSDNDIVTATYIGNETRDGPDPEFEIQVHALATTQENMGVFLDNEKVTLPADTYSFDVSINEMNYEFQFSIGENETNRAVQQRLMRLINNSDIGIHASLSESGGKSSLLLESLNTGLPLGRQEMFTISDKHTSKASGTVAYFGLDYVTRQPQNARFTVNGDLRGSPSNHFTLDQQFEVELHGISPEDHSSKVSLKTDVESLTENVSHLIGGYNEFIKAAAGYLDTQNKSKQLLREMRSIASIYGSSLNSTGVTMAEDGTLTINEEALQTAAEQSKDLSETFGYLKDFSSSLMQKSDQVSLNPMDYVDRTVVAYKNPGHNFYSPYNTSAYSGMMFNGYC